MIWSCFRHGRSPHRVDWEEAATGPQKRKGKDWQKSGRKIHCTTNGRKGLPKCSKVHSSPNQSWNHLSAAVEIISAAVLFLPRQCITTEEQTPDEDDDDANEVSLSFCRHLPNSPYIPAELAGDAVYFGRDCRNYWFRITQPLSNITNPATNVRPRPSTSFITSRRAR